MMWEMLEIAPEFPSQTRAHTEKLRDVVKYDDA